MGSILSLAISRSHPLARHTQRKAATLAMAARDMIVVCCSGAALFVELEPVVLLIVFTEPVVVVMVFVCTKPVVVMEFPEPDELVEVVEVVVVWEPVPVGDGAAQDAQAPRQTFAPLAIILMQTPERSEGE